MLASSCVGFGFLLGRKSSRNVSNILQCGDQAYESTSDLQYRSNSSSSLDLLSFFTLHAATPYTTPGSTAVPVQQPVNTVQNMVKYGFPSTDNLRSYEDFMLSYDRRTRLPNWVLEHLTPEKVTVKEGVERFVI